MDEALADGRLVEVLQAYAPAPIPIQAVFPTSRLLSAKVRAFLTSAEQAASQWRFMGRLDA